MWSTSFTKKTELATIIVCTSDNSGHYTSVCRMCEYFTGICMDENLTMEELSPGRQQKQVLTTPINPSEVI